MVDTVLIIETSEVLNDQVTTTTVKNQKILSKNFEKYLFSSKAEVIVS